MSTTSDKLDLFEERLTKLEISGARLDERLDNLVKSTANLKWSIWGFSFILLLAVVYGALGEKGFNSITHTYNQLTYESIQNHK